MVESKNLSFVRLQTNGVDAIFWQFLKPFVNVSISPIVPGFSANNNNNASNTMTFPGTSNTISTGALNNSNILVATNSNVSANMAQTYTGGSSDTAAASSSSAASASDTASSSAASSSAASSSAASSAASSEASPSPSG
jgi:hypothetical protein